MRTLLIVSVATVALIVAGAGCAAVRGGYASAPYQVVRTDGKFQLRDYPGLVLVQTPMGDADDSFMKLFHYIDRQNAGQQKIAMTTPVFMDRSGTNGTMAFVLPASLPLSRAPRPVEAGVRLAEMPGGRFAVLRFTGGMSARHEAAALARLRVWLGQQSLGEVGDPIYGYFDPPWTPPFWRRNEVMLRVESQANSSAGP